MRKTVVERKHDKHDRVFVDIDDRCALLYVRSVIAVGKQNALGVRSGSGCITDVGIVVGTDGGDALLKFCSIVLEELKSHFTDSPYENLTLLEFHVVEHDYILDSRALGDYAAHLVEFSH